MESLLKVYEGELMDLNKICNDAREESNRRDTSWDAERRRGDEEHIERLKTFSNNMSGKMRHANKIDYIQWLIRYLKNGGKITHVYDYKMQLDSWYVALMDFTISPLYGAEHKNLIVKDGVKLKGGTEGHNKLYFMDGFTTQDIVPIYSDIEF